MQEPSVEYAFTENVNADNEICAECGDPLAHSRYHVGMISDGGAGVPVVWIFHLDCAPPPLRAAALADALRISGMKGMN